MLVRPENGRILRTYDIARLHKNGQGKSSSDFGLAPTKKQKGAPTIPRIRKFLQEIRSRIREDSEGPHEVNGKGRMDVDGTTGRSVYGAKNENWRRGSIGNTGGRRKIQGRNRRIRLCNGSGVVSTAERRNVETGGIHI